MAFEQFVGERRKDQVEKNYQEVLHHAEIREKNLITKLENYIDRYYLNETDLPVGFPNLIEFLLHRVKTDKLFAMDRMKDPSKQGCHEKWQLEFIKTRLQSVQKLTGNSVYIFKGSVISKKQEVESGPKSIDFQCDLTKQWFAAKHTNNTGGNQDGVINELKMFVEHYSSTLEYGLVLVISGSYYTPSKIEELRKSVRGKPRVSIFHLDDPDNTDSTNFANSLMISGPEPINVKKEMGQFYSTNVDKLLQDLVLPVLDVSRTVIVEPFVGQGDLIPFCKTYGSVEAYDLLPNNTQLANYGIVATVQDTLLYPPNYDGKYVITNPPYLAKNKTKDKQVFNKYNHDDLYKCFIETLIDGNAAGGCLIIPLNFWCCNRNADLDLRKKFLNKYQVLHMNIFEDAAFDDTDYTVCSFSFIKASTNDYPKKIPTVFRPSGRNLQLNMSEYIIAPELSRLKLDDKIKLVRITESSLIKYEGQLKKAHFKLFAVDSVGIASSNHLAGAIRLVVVNEPYVGKESDRTYASFLWNMNLDIDAQKVICKVFNTSINNKRTEYYSLFLSNFRENQRKRITFNLAVQFINISIKTYLMHKKIPPSKALFEFNAVIETHDTHDTDDEFDAL